MQHIVTTNTAPFVPAVEAERSAGGTRRIAITTLAQGGPVATLELAVAAAKDLAQRISPHDHSGAKIVPAVFTTDASLLGAKAERTGRLGNFGTGEVHRLALA